MDKNKTIFYSVIAVCATIAFVGTFYFKAITINRQALKGRELEVNIYDQYTFCIRSAMDKSKDNGKPCTLQEAERACTKFNNTKQN